jgi:hypothetical protein
LIIWIFMSESNFGCGYPSQLTKENKVCHGSTKSSKIYNDDGGRFYFVYLGADITTDRGNKAA